MLIGELVEDWWLCGRLRVHQGVQIGTLGRDELSFFIWIACVSHLVQTNRNTFGACVYSKAQFLITFEFLLLQWRIIPFSKWLVSPNLYPFISAILKGISNPDRLGDLGDHQRY